MMRFSCQFYISETYCISLVEKHLTFIFLEKNSYVYNDLFLEFF